MSHLIHFDKLNNTRDLGGMKTTDGRFIREHLLFRSGSLSELSDHDVETLSGAVRTVVDLRSDGEREQKPDLMIPGVNYIHIPIVEDLTGGITREKEADMSLVRKFIFKPDEAKAYMTEMYRGFAEDAAARQYGRFMQILLDGSPVLWHCSAGKDRAGIASVIIEEALGVGREDIIEDYLKTGEYIRKDIENLTGVIKQLVGTDHDLPPETLQYLFGVEKDYLMTFYAAVDEKSGSMDSFLEESLGVDRNLLREKFLE